MAFIDRLASNDRLIRTSQATCVLGLSLISGVSFCLSTWCIPIILKSKSAKDMAMQHSLLISKGGAYLQPASRALTACVAGIGYLLSRSPNQAVAGKWRYWAAAVPVLVLVAPWESLMIFPGNGKIVAFEEGNDAYEGEAVAKKQKGELQVLLNEWRVRNLVRATLPLLASAIALSSLL